MYRNLEKYKIGKNYLETNFLLPDLMNVCYACCPSSYQNWMKWEKDLSINKLERPQHYDVDEVLMLMCKYVDEVLGTVPGVNFYKAMATVGEEVVDDDDDDDDDEVNDIEITLEDAKLLKQCYNREYMNLMNDILDKGEKTLIHKHEKTLKHLDERSKHWSDVFDLMNKPKGFKDIINVFETYFPHNNTTPKEIKELCGVKVIDKSYMKSKHGGKIIVSGNYDCIEVFVKFLNREIDDGNISI